MRLFKDILGTLILAVVIVSVLIACVWGLAKVY